jgi:quercetin dioxygenase-like cupin family protein
MENSTKSITAVAADEGKTFSVAGGNYRVVISGRETGGAYAIIEMLVPPMGGPGPHAHVEIQESFYVLDGEVEVKSEAGTYIAKKGSFINIPTGGLVHCFKNKSDALARLWCTVMPAGMEDMFAEIGKPVEPGVFLPPPVLDPDDLQKMKTIGEKYGQQFFPPDYLN